MKKRVALEKLTLDESNLDQVFYSYEEIGQISL